MVSGQTGRIPYILAQGKEVTDPAEPKVKSVSYQQQGRRVLTVAGLGIAISLAVLLVSSINVGPLKSGDWLKSLELKGYDFMMAHFPRPMPGAEEGKGPVAVVAIDQESIEQLGKWPWDRSLHGSMVDILDQAGARAIAIDILFSSTGIGEGDEALAGAMKRAGDVVLASSFSGWSTGGYEAVKVNLPLEIFQEAAAGIGFTNIPTDTDGVNRRVLLKETLGGYSYPGFAVLPVVLESGQWSMEEVDSHVPVTADGEMFINFSPNFNTATPAYSFLEVLEGKFARDAFRQKVVFVGVTGGAKLDAFPTPISGKESLTPGLVIQARAAATIESEKFISAAPPWAGKVMVVLVGPLVLLLFLGRRMLVAVALVLAGMVLLVLAEGLAFRTQGLWLPLMTPILAGLISVGGGLSYRYFTEVRKERQLKEVFGRYVSPDVLGELLEEPESASQRGRQLEASILFCDMYGFTTLAGSREPREVVELLNRFLSAVSHVIFEHGGTVDKFVGDEVMAIFGAPISSRDHALCACRAALDIQATLGKLECGPDTPLRAGIGVNSGQVVVGSIGSEKRMDYTAVGDTVNIASRLEGLTREMDSDIIIGADTYRLAGEAIDAGPLGAVRVKGKDEPIEVYGLTGMKENPPSA